MTMANDVTHFNPDEPTSNAEKYSLLSDTGNTVKVFMHLEKMYGPFNPLLLSHYVLTLVQEYAMPVEIMHHTADLFAQYARTALHGEGPDVAYYCFVRDFQELAPDQRKLVNVILTKLLADINAA